MLLGQFISYTILSVLESVDINSTFLNICTVWVLKLVAWSELIGIWTKAIITWTGYWCNESYAKWRKIYMLFLREFEESCLLFGLSALSHLAPSLSWLIKSVKGHITAMFFKSHTELFSPAYKQLSCKVTSPRRSESWIRLIAVIVTLHVCFQNTDTSKTIK
jgi:hypothetical protein